MAELVFFNNSEVVTTSLAIAEGTRNHHKNVLELARRWQADLEEFGRVEFQTRPFETAGGTQRREVALLNEQQATLLLTYMRNSEVARKFKKRLVKAFYEMAWERRGSTKVPQTLPEALRLAADLAEQNERQAQELEDARPAKQFVERYVETGATKSLREAAKVLGVGERAFIRRLVDEKVLYRQSGDLLPFSRYHTRGYFTVKTGEANGHAYHQTRVTARGIEWLGKRFGSGREVA